MPDGTPENTVKRTRGTTHKNNVNIVPDSPRGNERNYRTHQPKHGLKRAQMSNFISPKVEPKTMPTSPTSRYESACAIGETHTNKVILARDLPTPDNTKKCDFSNIDFDKLPGLLKGNNGLYEVIKTDKPVRLHFDIEWIENDRVNALRRYEGILFCLRVKLFKLFGLRGCTPVILQDHRETEAGMKWSYHFVYTDYIFRNAKHLRNAMIKLSEEMSRRISRWNKWLYHNRCSVIDWSIYTRHRQFRLPFQGKPGKSHVITPTQAYDVADMVVCPYWEIHDDAIIACEGAGGPLSMDKINHRVFPFLGRNLLQTPEGPEGRVPTPTISPPTIVDAVGVAVDDSELAHLLRFIPPECKFQPWYVVGAALKCNGGTFDLFHRWSRQSTTNYKGEHDCLRVWERISIDKNRLSRGTLYYLAKQYNPIFFTPYISNNDRFVDFNDLSHDWEETTSSGQYLPPITAPQRTVLIHAGMGTGKSFQTKKLIAEGGYHRVLVIAPRITFAEFITGELADLGFVCYRHTQAHTINHDKIVCSIESLHRISGHFDLVICDEIETILKSITSKTNSEHFAVTNTKWYDIITDPWTKVIGGDAFLTQRTIDYFHSLPGEVHLMTHKSTYPPKTMLRYENVLDFVEKFKQLVSDGKKIYLVCHSKKQILKIFEPWLKEKNISHLIYHRDVSNPRKKTLQNAEEEWTKVQVVITSPTISIGIDQHSQYFDHRMLYTCSMSATPRDTVQALWRVRQTTRNLDYWFCDKRDNHMKLKGRPTSHAELSEYLRTKHWGELPNIIATNEHIRNLAIWNILEDNVSCVASYEWTKSLLESLNYHEEVVKNQRPKLTTVIRHKQIPFAEIPILGEEDAMHLSSRMQLGGDTEVTEMEQASLRKYRFLKGTGGCEDKLDKLWVDCNHGYNLAPLTFCKWTEHPDTIPEDSAQLDIFYRYHHIHYRFIREIEAMLPAVGERFSDDVRAIVSQYLKDKSKYLKETAEIDTRGGDSDLVKSLNALLKRLSLLRIESKAVRQPDGSRPRVPYVTSPYENVRTAIRDPFWWGLSPSVALI